MTVAPLCPAHAAEDAPTPTCTVEVSRGHQLRDQREHTVYIGVLQASACAR